jgi:hypothetical protein
MHGERKKQIHKSFKEWGSKNIHPYACIIQLSLPIHSFYIHDSTSCELKIYEKTSMSVLNVFIVFFSCHNSLNNKMPQPFECCLYCISSYK